MRITIYTATRIVLLLAPLCFLFSCSEKSEPKAYDGAMVLALSWQAGFCETRSQLPECRSQNQKRYDSTHFSLHGLWPQPRHKNYCNVSQQTKQLDKARQWKKLPPLGLSQPLKQKLWQIMPGARSFLHRHEWIKHGTCYATTPEIYFHDSSLLVDALNRSAVQDFFATHIGQQVTNQQVRQAFDQSFGKGVGQRVRLACKRDGKRTLITEITLGLNGTITQPLNISQLALAASPTKAGCPAGIIDPVGLQ